MDREQSANFDARMFELTGLQRDDWRPLLGGSNEKFNAIYHKVDAEVYKGVHDKHGSHIRWDEIHDEMFSICEEIADLPAKTVADLVLFARAAALNNSHYWMGEQGGDPSFVKLVEQICTLAGVEAMPGLTEAMPGLTDNTRGS